MNKLFIVLSLALVLVGCTENQRARNFGGSATEKLRPGRKLVNVTWKQDNMWLLTRPMTTNDVAETYKFAESSSFGLVQGDVTIIESK